MSHSILTEETRRLMGIGPRENGGLPVLFARGQFEVGSKDPVAKKASPKQPLEERRSLQLFRNHNEMIEALKRAHKLVSRVNATIQSDRGATRGSMNEKSRADVYRLDQEMATSLDSISAACEAIADVQAGQKAAEQEARERRRMGR